MNLLTVWPVCGSILFTEPPRASQIKPSGESARLPAPGALIGRPKCGSCTCLNSWYLGSNLPSLCDQFSENQTMSFLSTVIQCCPGLAPAVDGTLYSSTTPVRGSSFAI